MSKPFTYFLDGASGFSLLFGAFTGHDILMILGGLASLAAFFDHGQRILQRKRKNDVGKNK